MITSLFVLGGARSGKSRFALAQHQGQRRVAFLATGEASDADMAARIARHRAERPARWRTLEEPLDVVARLREVAPAVDGVVVDCLTLWVANLVMSGRSDDSVLMEAGQLVADLSARTGPTVVVTNEVGLGVHPETDLGRRYRDVLGGVNRLAAAAARRTLFLVTGRAVRLDDPRELLE